MQPDIAPCEGIGRMAVIDTAMLSSSYGEVAEYVVAYRCPVCERPMEARTARRAAPQRVRVAQHGSRADA
jgi:hypothetical protein